MAFYKFGDAVISGVPQPVLLIRFDDDAVDDTGWVKDGEGLALAEAERYVKVAQTIRGLKENAAGGKEKVDAHNSI